MKFLVISKPARNHRFTAKQRLYMMQASKDWVENNLKNGLLDCAYTFIEGGAFSISNYDSAEAAFKEISNFPAYALFEWEVRPLADIMETLEEVISIFKKYAALEK